MRSTPLLLLAAIAAGSLAFAPATHGTAAQDEPLASRFMATDIAGDANGLNGQGLQETPGTSTGSAQLHTADILSARITSRYEARVVEGAWTNVLTGIELRTGIDAPADPLAPAMAHRFMGSIDGCRIWAQLYTGTGGTQPHGTPTVRLLGPECGVPDDATTGLTGSVTLAGDGITFEQDVETSERLVIIDLATAPVQLTEMIVPGAYYLLDEVAVRFVTPSGQTAPVIDELPGAGGYTVIGDDVPAWEPPVDDGDMGDCGSVGTGGSTPTEQTAGEDRTGVTDTTITVGLHAAATGAAPLPTTSFQASRDLYWRQLEAECRAVLGRTVEVEFRDDKGAPDQAIQACQELRARSVLLSTTGDPDQTQACGTMASNTKVPYLATGSTEQGLSDSPWHFATTMTHRQQGGLLAAYVAANPNALAALGPSARIGSIVVNSPNHDDALDGWLKGLEHEGLTNLDTFKHARGDRSWYADVASSFIASGITTVYFNSSAVDYVNFARTAEQRFGWTPQYVGVDSGLSYDAVLGSGCGSMIDAPAIDGGVFLSATGGLDRAPAGFLDAAAQHRVTADDVALRLWAIAESQHQLLDAYGEVFGTDLTREDLRSFIEGSGVETEGVHPAASWSPTDHRGGQAMHVVQADCGTRQHRTLHQHARDF